jgi:hypothetical protein
MERELVMTIEPISQLEFWGRMLFWHATSSEVKGKVKSPIPKSHKDYLINGDRHALQEDIH